MNSSAETESLCWALYFESREGYVETRYGNGSARV